MTTGVRWVTAGKWLLGSSVLSEARSRLSEGQKATISQGLSPLHLPALGTHPRFFQVFKEALD